MNLRMHFFAPLCCVSLLGCLLASSAWACERPITLETVAVGLAGARAFVRQTDTPERVLALLEDTQERLTCTTTPISPALIARLFYLKAYVYWRMEVPELAHRTLLQVYAAYPELENDLELDALTNLRPFLAAAATARQTQIYGITPAEVVNVTLTGTPVFYLNGVPLDPGLTRQLPPGLQLVQEQLSATLYRGQWRSLEAAERLVLGETPSPPPESLSDRTRLNTIALRLSPLLKDGPVQNSTALHLGIQAERRWVLKDTFYLDVALAYAPLGLVQPLTCSEASDATEACDSLETAESKQSQSGALRQLIGLTGGIGLRYSLTPKLRIQGGPTVGLVLQDVGMVERTNAMNPGWIYGSWLGAAGGLSLGLEGPLPGPHALHWTLSLDGTVCTGDFLYRSALEIPPTGTPGNQLQQMLLVRAGVEAAAKTRDRRTASTHP